MPNRPVIVAADGVWVVRAGGAIIGESARALELIGEALDHGLPWSEVETSPALEALRQHPRLRGRVRS